MAFTNDLKSIILPYLKLEQDYRIVVDYNSIMSITLHYIYGQIDGTILFYIVNREMTNTNLLIINAINQNDITNLEGKVIFIHHNVGLSYHLDQFHLQDSISSSYLPIFLTKPILAILQAVNLVNIEEYSYNNDQAINRNKQRYVMALKKLEDSLVNGKLVKS